MRRLGLVVLLVVMVTAACRRESSQATDRRPPAEPAFGIVVQPLSAPARGTSGQVQLTASSRGVLLSWLEQNDSSATLRFSELGNGEWSAAHTVASSDNWFISDADVPTVLRMSNGTLVATTYPAVDPTIEAYDLRLSYSNDEGKTWSRPLAPHHDKTKTQHGFASLFEQPDRTLGVVWLDGRAADAQSASAPPDQELNKTDPQGGAMDLYFASFGPTWKQDAESSINARVCECCQTATAITADGPVVAFRDRSGQEIRDIHVARIEQGKWTEARAVHADNWRIDACPVNGPALSARGRTVAVAWFTAIGDMGHAYAAFSQDAGRTWGDPIRLDDDTSLGHVDVELLEDGSAAASWVEFANERAQFRVRQVKATRERSLSMVIAGAGAGRVSGYPRLARSGRDLVFAWTESGGPGSQQVKTALGR
jgi:hypothetical protein